MAEDVASRLARVDEVLDELRREVIELRVENQALRRQLGEEPPTPARAPGDRPDGSDASTPATGMGRRRLILGGVTAGAAAVAGAMATAQPAAAANGGPLVMGQLNDATVETKLTTGSTAGNGLRVEGTGGNATVHGQASGAGEGVRGEHAGSGTGVHGVSDSGKAVHGTSNSGAGAQGTSTSGAGVWGESSSDRGVVGLSETFDGVYGESGSGAGVVGRSATGPGVSGSTSAAAGIGVTGTTATGSGVKGVATGNGTGVRGDSPVFRGVAGEGGAVGVSGFSPGGIGVYGTSADGVGVAAGSLNSIAIEASGPTSIRLTSYPGRPAPTADGSIHKAGEVVFVFDEVWLCVANGTPGTWRKVGGPATAGQFHVLPAPIRVDDAPLTSPSQGPKTPLSGNVARPVNCTHNNSGVPVGATAVSLTVLIVNAANANGNMTIWANGTARPSANTAVWGAGSGRYTTTAICGADAAAKIQVAASNTTDLVLDVVGYYR